MSSFFPWMGGKSKMASRLAAILPPHTCYVEVFSGAANLLFTKSASQVEVINDINSELVTLFRVVRYHPRAFLDELLYVTHSRVEFADFQLQPGLTDIQKAARFFFIAKVAFGGKAGASHADFGYGTTGRSRFRRSAFSAIRRCHKRLDGVYIENLDFAACIRRYDRPHTVFYCDPPYYQTAQYKAAFRDADHVRLASLLRAIEGKFLLSINDHPAVRSLYKGLPMTGVGVRYSVARDKSASATSRRELLIANYPIPKQL